MRISRFLPLMLMLLAASFARADCPGGSNTSCVTSFTISPGAIIEMTVHRPPSARPRRISPQMLMACGYWSLSKLAFFSIVLPLP